jgi:hypothetical protein
MRMVRQSQPASEEDHFTEDSSGNKQGNLSNTLSFKYSHHKRSSSCLSIHCHLTPKPTATNQPHRREKRKKAIVENE